MTPETGKRCENPSAYRFTWPGKGESYICEEHSGKLRAVADAIGLYLQLIPFEGDTCRQKLD